MSSPITEAVILAGGKGSRLQAEVPGIQKCLAPVAGKPFLHYIIRQLQLQEIRQFTFALGYQAENVQGHLEIAFPNLDKSFAVEKSPAGTGGAILNALSESISKQVLIVNGDTFFDFDLKEATTFHSYKKADCTLLLKPMQQARRYGQVLVDEDGRIIQFLEKAHFEKGLINAGAYLLNVKSWQQKNWPSHFSFEHDYLKAFTGKDLIFGCVQDGYFIDIGVPEDYQKAQSEMASPYFRP